MKEATIFCRKCGGPLKPGSKFCGACGAQAGQPGDAQSVPAGLKNMFIDRERRIRAQKKRGSRKQGPIFALLLVCAVVAGGAFYYWHHVEYSNPEPDWNERAVYWYNFHKTNFVIIPAGSTVSLRMTTGKDVKGKLISIENDKILIEHDGQEVGVYASVLDERTRYAFFSDFYSRKNAVRDLTKERAEWLSAHETAKEADPVAKVIRAIREFLALKSTKTQDKPKAGEEAIHDTFFKFLESE